MFPHLIHDAATLRMDAQLNYISTNNETYRSSLLTSMSMVESTCTRDEDVCMTAAPNCISPVSTVVGRTVRSASDAALEDRNQLRVPLSPYFQVMSADGLEAVGGEIRGHRKMLQRQAAQTAFQEYSYGYYSPWSSSDTAPVMKASDQTGSGAGTDMDCTVRAMLLSHAPTLELVPSVEEMASLRPHRRNVRISKHPQSVAARHRRERIGDRMRVLQRLVPGGTKMDTASMLDEAIHYVQFLQLQVQSKLGAATAPPTVTMHSAAISNSNDNNNISDNATAHIQASPGTAVLDSSIY